MEHSLLPFTPHLEQQYDLVLPDGTLDGEGGSMSLLRTMDCSLSIYSQELSLALLFLWKK